MDTLDQLRQALAQDPRIGATVAVSWQHPGVLEMHGELPRLAAKKLALGLAVSLPGVSALIDGLTVRPELVRNDGAIRADLRDAMLQDELFHRCVVREVQPDGSALILTGPAPALGDLTYGVQDGIVTWNGVVDDMVLKRLASVVAWWVPGVRDVVNDVDAEDDGGDHLAEAVRLAHQRDPFLATGIIAVTAEDGIVLLTGQVASPDHRLLAEDDAWAVWDVAEVINHLVVRGAAA